MTKHLSTAMGREHLDARFARIAPAVPDLVQPPKGWIKAIRQALGMSERQLAQRLGVRQPSVADIERSEAAGRIQLATLQKAAAALNCRLVYALVPEKSLTQTVRQRMREVASRRLDFVEHTMRLENQQVTDVTARERELDALARVIDARTLWDEP